MNPLQPELPKPEVKPEPPVVKPDPKPEPEKPNKNNPFPNPESVKTPAGWTKDKLKEHDAKVIDKVYKNAPIAGLGMSFGTSKLNIESFDDPTYLSGIEKELEVIKSSMTIQEWVDAANQVIKSGDIYIAPDYSFALYASYELYQGKNYVKIHFAH